MLTLLTIVPASAEETHAVIAILSEAARWLGSRGLPSWNPDTLPVVMSAAVSRGEVYLARIDDRPVGTISVQWSDPTMWGEQPDDAGYIHKLAIVRAAAGQHIGAEMLTWGEGLIAEHGRRFARLDCHAENPTINAFYEAAGYQLRGGIMFHDVLLNLREKRLV
jgi:ribosomal protein S18 acetylase RimI-like enzyme